MRTIPFWLWLNIFGLDAPVITVLWQNAFAEAFGIRLEFPMRLGLFCVVWAVYLGDRLLDGLRLNVTETSSARHRFAAKHPLLITILLLPAIAGAAYAALLTPKNLLCVGAALGISTILYFLWNQAARGSFSRKYFKEIIICTIFVLGVLAAPATLGAAMHSAFFISAVIFFLVCLSNCAMISRIERDIDIARGEESYAIHFAGDLKPARWISVTIVVLSIVLTFINAIPLILAISFILTGIGLCSTVFVERITSPRFSVVWADLCLMSPVLLLDFHHLPQNAHLLWQFPV
ncbi:MAG: hypothetical protein ABIP97_09930 [Chthoniobacterales bacterium]